MTAFPVRYVLKTCSSLRSLLASRLVWLQQLRDLDQCRQPGLKPHVQVEAFSATDLRLLVVQAHRFYQNTKGEAVYCTAPPAKASRVISVDLENSHGALGYIDHHQNAMALSPDGQYLFVRWSGHVLQIWDVPQNACLWTYPSCSSSSERLAHVTWYDFETQADGGLTVLVVIADQSDSWYVLGTLCKCIRIHIQS